jgi:hypothetical protein
MFIKSVNKGVVNNMKKDNRGIATVVLIICVAIIAVVIVAETAALFIIKGKKSSSNKAYAEVESEELADNEERRHKSKSEVETESETQSETETESEVETEVEDDTNKVTASFVIAEVIRAYQDYAYEQGFDRVSLIYLDDDDIPEMVFNSGVEAGGGAVCTYYDGKVDMVYMSGTYFGYINRQGVLYNGYGHMGFYGDSVLQYKDGQFTATFSGNYSVDVDEYGNYAEGQSSYELIDPITDKEEEVTEDEYAKALDMAIDINRLTTSYDLDYYYTVYEAYEQLSPKIQYDEYYDVMYDITEFSLDNNVLTVKNRDGDINLELEISPDCEWFGRYTDVSICDSSYESIYSSWENIPKDLDPGEYESPEGFGIIVEDNVVTGVYFVAS